MIDRNGLHPACGRHRLDHGKLRYPNAARRIAQHNDPRGARRNLEQQVEPLTSEAVLKLCEARNITARPRHALDIA
jgi:hypothetical protein